MWLRMVALVLAAAAVAALAAAGPGVRLELWPVRTGFELLRYAAYLGIAGAAVALVALLVPRWRKGGLAVLGLALVASVASTVVPFALQRQARGVPPIHDISTDTESPPAFVALLPLRAGAPNPPAYPGAQTARLQHEAYPDIAPIALPLSPSAAFERALAAAREMGWEVIAHDPVPGRIEAVATTRWFGFKDDVVIRVSAREGGGSRIDVRSKSRLGRSDAGTNARRIRAFRAAVLN